MQALSAALRLHLPLRGQRLAFLAQFVLALIAVRTVNLAEIAVAFYGRAKTASSYRRIQRFFKTFEIPQKFLASFVLSLLPQGPHWLSMDRTNWKFGRMHINILTVGIVHRGAAFPIAWMLLPESKSGNSRTEDRIALLERVIALLGKEHIAGLLADREFVGKKWFRWLRKRGIRFCIRIKENFKLRDGRKVREIFRDLKEEEARVLPGSRVLCGVKVFLAATKLEGEYLIVASSVLDPSALETYRKRWEIETLFGCLKTRGFNFEDTHMTDPEKISKLLALLTVAFSWAHAVGEQREDISATPLKAHGRKAVSIFRRGLDHLRRIVLDIAGRFQAFGRCLRLLWNGRTERQSSA